MISTVVNLLLLCFVLYVSPDNIVGVEKYLLSVAIIYNLIVLVIYADNKVKTRAKSGDKSYE